MGNGVTVMSMVFFSSALISLAENEYYDFLGLKPSSLVTAIGTVSGILSAIMLPFMGAVVDGTPYRKTIGTVFTLILVGIQTIQIGTRQWNWMYMALLQAINGFVFQITTLAAYSYLPEMARDIGERRMTKYSSKFFIMMFALESLYLIIVIGISIHFELNDAATGQVALAINLLLAGFCYYYGWYFFSSKEGNLNSFDEGDQELTNISLCKSGFQQVFRTASGIFKHYASSLGWYLFAVIFAEAGKM
jgi:MFS-type transporter involved in bile tolerance (Atg22 family)